MARTNLPLTALTANGAVLNNGGTAIDAANGMNIQLPTTGLPASGFEDRLVLYVQNTTASTKTVTVRAGANPNYLNVPAFRAGQGDFTSGNLSATTGSAFIGPFEAARFMQVDGSINVDFAAGMTGLIWAVLVPRAF